MDEKISLEAISLYADAYSDHVLRGFFDKNDKITGQEILSLCNVHQVNLFVVKELLKAWKEEQKKIKSPYFNYENPEVKEALETLMSLLSQNILINRERFTPLLKRAVSQTLLIIFDPYDYFSILISGRNNKLDVNGFREEIKYLKINKAPLERMLQKLDEKNQQEISGNEAFAVLDEILEEVSFNPEDIEEYVDKFSAVVPLDPNRFFIPKNDMPYEKPVQQPSAQHPPVQSPTLQQSFQQPQQPQPFAQHVPKQNVPKQQPVNNVSPTVNDKLSTKQQRPTLAENFQRIKSIKESLTINQKFMFTKVLFHGDFELFTRAIERLDQLDHLQAAIRYIEEEHASTWDKESEEFHEFMELVEKRFV